MPDIDSQETIILRPGDDNVPIQFYAEPCSSGEANDGAIPYGSNVAAVTITAKDEDGGAAADVLDGAATFSANVITQLLKYPATSGVGNYALYIQVTLDNIAASVINFIADRIIAEDR